MRNLESAKIKVPFTTDIDILRVAPMHRTVTHHINTLRIVSTPAATSTAQKVVSDHQN